MSVLEDRNLVGPPTARISDGPPAAAGIGAGRRTAASSDTSHWLAASRSVRSATRCAPSQPSIAASHAPPPFAVIGAGAVRNRADSAMGAGQTICRSIPSRRSSSVRGDSIGRGVDGRACAMPAETSSDPLPGSEEASLSERSAPRFGDCPVELSDPSPSPASSASLGPRFTRCRAYSPPGPN